jgi:hypothetical protein
MITCPHCDTVATSFHFKQDHQELEVCPDGYNEVYSEFLGHNILEPKSGRTITEYVAGKSQYYLIPCNCRVAGVKLFKDNLWEVHYWHQSEGIVALVGEFPGLQPIPTPT